MYQSPLSGERHEPHGTPVDDADRGGSLVGPRAGAVRDEDQPRLRHVSNPAAAPKSRSKPIATSFHSVVVGNMVPE